jgi:hypothetical protein
MKTIFLNSDRVSVITFDTSFFLRKQETKVRASTLQGGVSFSFDVSEDNKVQETIFLPNGELSPWAWVKQQIAENCEGPTKAG